MKMIRQHTKSLRGRINLSFLLIVAIAVVSFMIISIDRSSMAIMDISEEYTLQLVQMVNKNIEVYIENMENISRIVTNSSDVNNYLTLDSDVDIYAEKVAEQFGTLKETRDDIYNIGIIGTDGRYLINDLVTKLNPYAKIVTKDWYCRALEGKEVISSSYVQNIVSDKYYWVVTMSKAIRDPIDNEVTGVFFVDLNYRVISNLGEEVNLGQKGYLYIVDEEGDIVYHPKQQLIYSGLWEEELGPIVESRKDILTSEDGSKLYTLSKSKVTCWTVVGVTYMNEMLSSTDEIINIYYIMAVILIGVAMLLAVLLTNKITLPLRRLQESMKAVEQGDFEVEIANPNMKDEIGNLIRSFQIMVRKIKQLIEHNNKEQEEKRKSELNALQAQINPHFLYNTLDSIIWMTEDGNTRDVVLMTSSLAKLFRKSISNKNELITVAEEIEYTKSYLTIQKMRYKDKLKYSIVVEPTIEDMKIIKLIVQPLVENAIYHGIKYKKGIGTIFIEVGYHEKGILIRVMDDGKGMTEEQLMHIYDKRENDTKKNGVGVLNVYSRIQLYYGKEYGLSFVSSIGMGTIASIYLPGQMGGTYESHTTS